MSLTGFETVQGQRMQGGPRGGRFNNSNGNQGMPPGFNPGGGQQGPPGFMREWAGGGVHRCAHVVP
jgi:hypothetical protein